MGEKPLPKSDIRTALQENTKFIVQMWGKVGPLFALILVIGFFGFLEPEKFLSYSNFGNVAGQTAVIAIAAVGMTFVIISAGIDLSVGSLVALTGVMAAMTMSSNYYIISMFPYVQEMPPWQANAILLSSGICMGIFAGALCGLINGAAITYGKLPPFIVTLGMMEIIRGTAFYIAGGLPITGMPPGFRQIGNQSLYIPLEWAVNIPVLYVITWMGTEIEIPYSVFLIVPVALIGAFILRYTVFGVQVYAIGSNEQTARLCGVKVNKVKMWVYIICGITAGIAGVLHASRLNTGQPSEGVGMELHIIAAVVIGGASLMGGEGTILGAIVGAFIIILLRNGCNLVGVSPFVQRIVIGLIIIISVFLDQMRRRASTK
jgi:ribose transport system permease protein